MMAGLIPNPIKNSPIAIKESPVATPVANRPMVAVAKEMRRAVFRPKLSATNDMLK